MSDSPTAVTGLKVLKAVVWIVYALATAAIIILAFAFVLLIFDADTSAGFGKFIADAGSFFATPFKGMIDPTELSNGGSISWSALVAIAAYAVLAAIVGAALNAISRRIYVDTRSSTVGQRTVTRTHQEQGGDAVITQTTTPVVQPSPVEQEAAARRAEAERKAAAEQQAE